MMSSKLPSNFLEIKKSVSRELYENVLPFWSKYSHDDEYGGWFACLDKDGDIYDERKFIWLNGRQLWMFARLCSDVSSADIRDRSRGLLESEKLLHQAERAADFLLAHSFSKEGLAYFSLSRQGRPYSFQRKMFSACFICIGLGSLSKHSTLSRASVYRSEARKLLLSIVNLSHDPSPLGREDVPCDGAPPTSPMNVPMILLNVIDEMRKAGAIEGANDDDGIFYTKEEEWCIHEILKHVDVERKLVFENVNPDGSAIPGYDGRHMNPGHAIEAGWFVLSYAERHGREDLMTLATNIIEWSFEIGWDKEHGGLYYFLDSEGKSPPYLEWNMKLWYFTIIDSYNCFYFTSMTETLFFEFLYTLLFDCLS